MKKAILERTTLSSEPNRQHRSQHTPGGGWQFEVEIHSHNGADGDRMRSCCCYCSPLQERGLPPALLLATYMYLTVPTPASEERESGANDRTQLKENNFPTAWALGPCQRTTPSSKETGIARIAQDRGNGDRQTQTTTGQNTTVNAWII